MGDDGGVIVRVSMRSRAPDGAKRGPKRLDQKRWKKSRRGMKKATRRQQRRKKKK